MTLSKSASRLDFIPQPRISENKSGLVVGHRRYSARIEASALAEDERIINPAQPQTWDPTWAAAFRQLKNDGEVHRENLPDLLRLVGHRDPDEEIVKRCADKASSYASLPAQEVFDFIRRFEGELRDELRSAFNDSAVHNGGKVSFPELVELVQRRGFTPIPHAIQEVLEEVASELGASIGDGVSLSVFERLMELLEQREGFCKSDLKILESAFERFDENRNGVIDPKELEPLLESLDFCLDEGVVDSLVSEPLRDNDGTLTWKDFVRISRKRVALEFELCQQFFSSCDHNEDGLLEPGELMRVFLKIGVSMLPETLVDITEECGVDGSAIDFQAFWKMLQVLRGREGFTLQEAADILEVYAKFDSSGRGEMPLKRVPAALTWLGFQCSAGVLGKAHKQVAIPTTGSSYMTEVEFMKLARKHVEAQQRAFRKVYRAFAEDGGAKNLSMEHLQAAVTRLNRLFVSDFLDWIKVFRPAARIARKHISFDFEEFRIISLHCAEKLRARIQKNSGFSEVQLSRLRIEFVKYTKGGSNSEVPPKGLVKLFKALFPLAQTSNCVRNRLRRALEMNDCRNSGLDWHTFLRVMRTYDDLVELDAEQSIQSSIDELCVPDDSVEEAQDLISIFREEDSRRLTERDVRFLVQGIAPGLTKEHAEEVLNRLQDPDGDEEDDELLEDEVPIAAKVKRLTRIVLSGDPGTRSPARQSARPHDQPPPSR